MFLFEILIREFFAVNRLASSALDGEESQPSLQCQDDASSAETHVATGEVTALEHEIRDDTMETGAGVAEALFASAKSTEILSGLGNDVVVKVEFDSTSLFCDDVSRGSDTVRCVRMEGIGFHSKRWGRDIPSPLT